MAYGGPLVNVALGRPATQSSDAGHRDPGKPADANATSGVLTGGWGFHTEADEMPWWMLDLQEPRAIHRLVVYNRENAATENADTLTISVGPSASGPWQVIHQNAGRIGGILHGNPLVVALTEAIEARYVRLHLTEARYFHLDEVEIYAPPHRDDPTYLTVLEAHALQASIPIELRGADSSLVNSPAWNRAVFCGRWALDYPAMIGPWFHGFPQMQVDPRGIFDGRIATLRLRGYGGLGNAIYELINATMIARALGCTAIENSGKDGAANAAAYQVDGILMSPPGSPRERRPALDGCMYWPSNGASLIGNYSAAHVIDTITRFVNPTYQAYHDAAGDLGDHVIALHFRAGDIFTPGPMEYAGYVQPPASHYVKSIKYAMAHLGVTTVHVVFQDRSNPSVDMVEDYLVANNIPYTAQSASLLEDMATLLSARHLVAAYGTFSEAIALISNQIKTYFGFRYFSTQAGIGFWAQSRVGEILRAKGARTFLTDDPDGSYIPPHRWANTPEQLDLMRHFPETRLRLMERFRG